MTDHDDSDRSDDELMAAARKLPREVEPERDLWPDIAAAIVTPAAPARSGFDWRPMLAQAAAVLVLVGGSSALTYVAVRGDAPTGTAVSDTPAFSLDAARVNFGDRYALGPDFIDARRDLESRLDEELRRLSPEARAEVEDNLAAIRAAIAEINAALAEEPDNALLQELLLSSYREELAVMRKVNGITHTVMRRTDI